MTLTGREESGAEEWSCPTCGRRELLRWPPDYKRVVLEDGDLAACHFGAKGGVRVSEVTVHRAPGSDFLPDERQWLWDNGIDCDRFSG